MIRSNQDKAFEAAGYILLSILAILALAPFILLISSSLTDNDAAIRNGYQFLPSVFSTEAYRYILNQWQLIGRAYGITILVTVIGTAVSLVMSSSIGYALSLKNVKGIKLITFLVLFTTLFNGGIVATYLVYNNLLHIKNTIFALIIPNLMLNGFNVLLVRNYFSQNVPPELIEAAEIDGAGTFRIYWQIALPLAKPILATTGLITAIAYWNDWTNGLYFISKPELYSVQQLLNEINNSILFLMQNTNVGMSDSAQSLPSVTARMAIAVIAILPVILAYPFFQKYFVKGITVGGVKG